LCNSFSCFLQTNFLKIVSRAMSKLFWDHVNSFVSLVLFYTIACAVKRILRGILYTLYIIIIIVFICRSVLFVTTLCLIFYVTVCGILCRGSLWLFYFVFQFLFTTIWVVFTYNVSVLREKVHWYSIVHFYMVTSEYLE